MTRSKYRGIPVIIPTNRKPYYLVLKPRFEAKVLSNPLASHPHFCWQVISIYSIEHMYIRVNQMLGNVQV